MKTTISLSVILLIVSSCFSQTRVCTFNAEQVEKILSVAATTNVNSSKFELPNCYQVSDSGRTGRVNWGPDVLGNTMTVGGYHYWNFKGKNSTIAIKSSKTLTFTTTDSLLFKQQLIELANENADYFKWEDSSRSYKYKNMHLLYSKVAKQPSDRSLDSWTIYIALSDSPERPWKF